MYKAETMKKNAFVIFVAGIMAVVAIVVMVLTSCDRRQNPQKLTVSDNELSACHAGEKSEFPDPVFNYGNGDLQVTHELLLNCAASSVEVDAHVVDNEIFINYLVDDNISANCMCPKTLEYTLHNVPRGTYTIIITIEETELYHHTVTL